jgi:protein-S-isoprenylcysteine O-methyltransferase Ste14
VRECGATAGVARIEEADLASDFGEPCDDYRRKVPMLIPWRGPAAL